MCKGLNSSGFVENICHYLTYFNTFCKREDFNSYVRKSKRKREYAFSELTNETIVTVYAQSTDIAANVVYAGWFVT